MYRRYLVFIIICTLSLGACKNESENKDNATPLKGTQPTGALTDTSNLTTVQWLDSVQQFGKVTDGEKVLISFNFKNTGSKPLVISNVTAGCGCTVPEKPEAPIQPGEQGIIKAEFNSSGRVGQVSKNVTVSCNTIEQNYTLVFEGEVTETKQQTK
jgi:hypothetical protein